MVMLGDESKKRVGARLGGRHFTGYLFLFGVLNYIHVLLFLKHHESEGNKYLPSPSILCMAVTLPPWGRIKSLTSSASSRTLKPLKYSLLLVAFPEPPGLQNSSHHCDFFLLVLILIFL